MPKNCNSDDAKLPNFFLHAHCIVCVPIGQFLKNIKGSISSVWLVMTAVGAVGLPWETFARGDKAFGYALPSVQLHLDMLP